MDIGSVKFFIRLRQVNDPFDKPDNTYNPAAYQAQNQLNDPGFCVTQIKFMNAKSTEQQS